MTTFKEGYKGDWGRAVQSNVLVCEMFGHYRSFEMKSLEALMFLVTKMEGAYEHEHYQFH